MIEITRTFPAEDVSTVQVSLGRGDLAATAGSGSQLDLRARIHGKDDTALDIQLEEGTLTLKGRESNDRSTPTIDIYLTLPAGEERSIRAHLGKGDARLEQVDGQHRLELGSGDAHVAGGTGALVIETGKGDVHVMARQGSLKAATGKGDVHVGHLQGALRISSGAGDVHVRDWSLQTVAGDEPDNQIAVGSGDITAHRCQASRLRIHTARGDCSLEQASINHLKVDTAKGDIHLAGDPGRGKWRATTSKGDLALNLLEGVAARVEAATRRGTIHSTLPQVRVGRPGPASRHGGGRTIGLVGDEPRADVQLETVIGDIQVMAATATVPQAPPQAIAKAPSAMPSPEPAAAVPPAEAAMAVDDGTTGLTAMEILESLARNEITVDEADTLLRNIG